MKQQQAFEYFVRMGWSPAQSAGIVANLVAESNLNPRAVGDGGLAHGIAQWHPNRREGFEALIGKPFDQSTLEDQLAWVHAELQSTEKAAGEALQNCATAAEAGACVSMRYERPADIEGEASKRAKLAETILATYGGTVGVAVPGVTPPTPAPVSDTAAPIKQQPETVMGPLIFLDAILEAVPTLVGVFGKGQRGQQNAQAAQIVVDAFKRAVPGAVNEQDAIQKVQTDPALKAQVKAAVMADPNVLGLIEVGGGIAAARKANAEAVGIPFWRRGEFLISILLLALVAAIVGDVLYAHPQNWTPNDRTMVLTLAVAIVSAVMGYWIGSSIGSMRKTELGGSV